MRESSVINPNADAVAHVNTLTKIRCTGGQICYGAIFFACLASTPAASATPGDSEANQWLERMMFATRNLNYDGTFVFRKGKAAESMRIIHRADKSGERERLVSLSGVAREVLRDNSTVTCILPDTSSVVVGKSRPKSLIGAAVLHADERLNDNYDLKTGPPGRVAGRLSNLLEIRPRDMFRYGYRLWLDQESGLLLKSELVNAGGEVLEQVEYMNISLPATIPDQALQPEISGEGFRWIHNEATLDAPRKSLWKVTWLPDGFTMSDRIMDPLTAKPKPMEHLVYSDGLASLSIFFERSSNANEALDGASSMGAISAYGRMVEGFQVTVVGQMPEIAVQRVAQSIVRQ